MKKILIIILSFWVILPFRGASQTIQDIYTDGDCFQVDDSLLRVHCPQVMVKPLAKEVTSIRTFSNFSYLHFTPNDSQKPYYLIVTPNSLMDSLRNEITTYAEDVHAIHGFGIRVIGTENASAEQLKSLFMQYQDSLCGAVLIGNMPAAMYEIANDYNQYGYKKWPCDLYYMDLDGTWLDSDNNGIFDRHTGNVAPEIFVGRLSAEGLSVMGDEVTLLKRQLRKSHDFWWNAYTLQSDTALNYIDKDWVNIFNASNLEDVFNSSNVDDIRYGAGSSFSPSDYLQRIAHTNYGFTQLAAHSSPIRHQLTNGDVTVSNIRNVASSNIAYNLFCCSACNWKSNSSQGYLGGAYLFAGEKTVAVVGSSKTGGMLGEGLFYSSFSSNCLGDALLQWWLANHGNTHKSKTIWWSYGMTLLGDPSICMGHDLSEVCEDNLTLTQYPTDNTSNHVMFKAGSSIRVMAGFTIPIGVHVVFDAPTIIFEDGFNCPLGATFETRSEGCVLLTQD